MCKGRGNGNRLVSSSSLSLKMKTRLLSSFTSFDSLIVEVTKRSEQDAIEGGKEETCRPWDKMVTDRLFMSIFFPVAHPRACYRGLVTTRRGSDDVAIGSSPAPALSLSLLFHYLQCIYGCVSVVYFLFLSCEEGDNL